MVGKGLVVAIPVLLTAALTSGCQQPTSQDHVLDQWARRMDMMGLIPIVPPQEDLRVGDIYAYSVNPRDALTLDQRRNATRLIAATTRWGALPVLPDLDREYRQRRSWPKTPEAYLQTEVMQRRAWYEPETSTDSSIFSSEETPTRLRMVNLESLTSISFSAVDLAGLIPTEIAPLLTNELEPTNFDIILRMGSAESYSLSMTAIVDLLTEPHAAQGDTPGTGRRIRQPYRDNLQFVADAANVVWLSVITEVVYIRSADITVRPVDATPKDDEVTVQELTQVAEAMEQPSAAEPAGETAAEPTQQPQSDTGTQSGTPTGLAAYTATKLDPVFGAFLRAKAINDMLRETDTDDTPGGAVRFLTVTDESVALRKIWPRGLAIGVRGLALEVDATTGDIRAANPLMWPVSVAVGTR